MPSLSGSLVDVTSAPSDATEVWIRAADGRVSGANVVLEETRRVTVTGGKFTVNVLPGRAHLVVIHAGMSQEHVPLLVQDGMTTIAEAVRLGDEDWDEYTPSQADQIKAEIAAEVAKAATNARAAKTAQQAAEKARTDTQNALSTKADKVHTHALADVTGLQAALNGKANTSHTHTTAQVTGLDSALASKATQADMVALQQKLAALTAPITVFQGSHKLGSGALQVQTPRMYGTVTITVNQYGPENQAGLVQPRIYDHTGTRHTQRMGDWMGTTGGAGTAYKYLPDVASGQSITLDPGYYIEGIEIHSWQTGANTVTKITVQN